MAVIDAEGAVVGRLGARVAKMLLLGQHVEILNAQSAVMAGSLVAAKEKYLSRRSQKNKRNPDESPKWPRTPHLLLRRMIRGMLPFSSQRGRDAYKRLRVLSPEEKPQEGKVQRLQRASSEGKARTYTLLELCRELGMRKK